MNSYISPAKPAICQQPYTFYHHSRPSSCADLSQIQIGSSEVRRTPQSMCSPGIFSTPQQQQPISSRLMHSSDYQMHSSVSPMKYARESDEYSLQAKKKETAASGVRFCLNEMKVPAARLSSDSSIPSTDASSLSSSFQSSSFEILPLRPVQSRQTAGSNALSMSPQKTTSVYAIKVSPPSSIPSQDSYRQRSSINSQQLPQQQPVYHNTTRPLLSQQHQSRQKIFTNYQTRYRTSPPDAYFTPSPNVQSHAIPKRQSDQTSYVFFDRSTGYLTRQPFITANNRQDADSPVNVILSVNPPRENVKSILKRQPSSSLNTFQQTCASLITRESRCKSLTGLKKVKFNAEEEVEDSEYFPKRRPTSSTKVNHYTRSNPVAISFKSDFIQHLNAATRFSVPRTSYTVGTMY